MLRVVCACVPRLLASLALLGAGTALAQTDSPAPPPARDPFPGLYAAADVFGPGGRFRTEIVSLASGRVSVLQVHQTHRIEQLAVGSIAFERTPRTLAWAAAPPETAAVVRGHDIHRLVLARGDAASRPARIEAPAPDRPLVRIDLFDWRDVHGVPLPFEALYFDGKVAYRYRYSTVLPFRPAPGVDLPASPMASFARLGDLGSLAAAHEQVMAAHRASDAELLASGASRVATVSGRGELTESRRDAFLERMRAYLGAIRFERYADTELPVVAVSADGTMGWVACEIEAKGVRTEEGRESPVDYAFSWVELYSRSSARAPWIAVGNASSEKPAPP